MRHLLDDPYLAPYRAAILGRAEHARRRAAELAGNGSLAAVATVHERHGLHRLARRGWVFREWAPNATAMWLVGDFSAWRQTEAFRLKRLPGTDDWEGRFPASAIRHGQFYRLQVAWPGGAGERIPACARRVVQDAKTNLFAAQVWEPPRPYVWRHPAPPRPATPLIYEAHVGMSGEEPRVATYDEFRRRMLPRIRAAGYNTVQLMAIAEHPYYGSFGYHVSAFFAPSSRFGTPEDLMRLVDDAHGLGLCVIMDLVHSHAVKNERDGLARFDGTAWQYFHDGPRGTHAAWDSRCFDYGKDRVIRFLLSNARYWLDAFRFDGYRFDGVTSMLYRHHGLGVAFTDYGQYFDGATDDDAWCYLALANRVIHETHPNALTIAEDVSGMPGCAAPLADGGLGFDCRMAMGIPDFWFRLAEKVRDEDWPMAGIYHALTDRRAEEKTVSYVESHDQALVGGKSFFFQLADAAVYDGMRRDQANAVIDRAMALHKMARLATAALNGGAYLAFMGNEFGHPEWIDFPREGNGWSYEHARRLWHLRDDPTLRFKALADFDAAMLAAVAGARRGGRLAKMFPDPVRLVADEADKVLAFLRGDRVCVFNFHPTASWPGYGILVPPGRYRTILDTDEPRFGGQGRIAHGQTYATENVVRRGEIVQQVKLYLPARTALVLARQPSCGGCGIMVA